MINLNKHRLSSRIGKFEEKLLKNIYKNRIFDNSATKRQTFFCRVPSIIKKP